MKSIRTRVIVALAGSAVLASGLSVAAVAASSAAAGAAVVADGTTTGTAASPNATIYDV
jgi:glutamate synthase domain-containing protein 2